MESEECVKHAQKHSLSQRVQGEKLCTARKVQSVNASSISNAVAKPCYNVIPDRCSRLSAWECMQAADLSVRAWNTESMMGPYLAAGWKANLCSSPGALLACNTVTAS